MTVLTLAYAHETWTSNKHQRSMILTVKISYLRGACGVNKMGGKSYESVTYKYNQIVCNFHLALFMHISTQLLLALALISHTTSSIKSLSIQDGYMSHNSVYSGTFTHFFSLQCMH